MLDTASVYLRLKFKSIEPPFSEKNYCIPLCCIITALKSVPHILSQFQWQETSKFWSGESRELRLRREQSSNSVCCKLKSREERKHLRGYTITS